MSRKNLGYLLLTLATVAATLAAARTPVLTGLFIAGCLVMILAVLVQRRGDRPKPDVGAPAAGADQFDFKSCLAGVNLDLERLASERELSCERIHLELSGLLEGPLFDFARCRQQLAPVVGYASFARLIGEFTRAERSLNRAWSAAVDSYLEEARASLNEGRERFIRLERLLDELSG